MNSSHKQCKLFVELATGSEQNKNTILNPMLKEKKSVILKAEFLDENDEQKPIINLQNFI